jgi:hypothetical protein
MIVAKARSTGPQEVFALGGWLVEDFSSLSLRARDSRPNFWSVSAMDTGIIAPLAHVFILHFVGPIAYRDDDRCQKEKYGKCRDQYL